MKTTRKSITKYILIFLGATLCIGCIGVGAFVLNEVKRAMRPTRDPVPRISIQMSMINTAIISYEAQEGKLPASLDVLVQKRYYLEKEYLTDPWGEPIGYEHNGGEYIIWSSGPDRKMGTADDIFNGFPPSHMESWKAKLAQALSEQGTNAVQGATAGTIQPLASTNKVTPNRVPAATAQPPAEPSP